MSIHQFIFRTPLLRLGEMKTTEEELLYAYENNLVRESLFFASRDLYKELINMPRDTIKRQKVLISLYKYYSRMCTRCTPFGYFAGINVGNFENKTKIELSASRIVKLRLDMDYLCNLYYETSRDKSIYQSLLFYPNNTLYKVDDQWRFIEYTFKDTTRFHNLVSIDDNEMLSSIFAQCKNGVSFNIIVAIILNYGFDENEAMQYVHQLIDNQVFISNLHPTVTGDEYQKVFLDSLERTQDKRFFGVEKQLNVILENEAGIIETSLNVESLLSKFNAPIHSDHIIQVDLLKTAQSCSLDKNVKVNIEEVTNMLAILMPPNSGQDTLERFKMALYERHENAFIPLSEVMDTDIGIGYKNAISNYWSSLKLQTITSRDSIKELKLDLFLRARCSHSQIVDLTDEDIKNIYKNKLLKPLPSSYSFIGSLMQNGDGSTDVHFKSAGGPSALNLIGRFGHLDPAIQSLCLELVDKDNNNFQNVLLAEIVHLPQGRLGNILTRPHYRNHEIVYLGKSTLPTENQIFIDDLLIGVVDFRIVLYSKKHKMEVIPRLSNAHNYQYDSLPTYQFLCNLQTQGLTSSVYWHWEELINQPFLPRITYKNIIITPAKWNVITLPFKKIDLEDIHSNLLHHVQNLGIPKEFLIIQGDNELYIDISTDLGKQTFLTFCKKFERLSIEEFFFNQANTTDGFTNEIIIPFHTENVEKYKGIESVILPDSSARTFTPFSEWVYLKVYTGKKSCDKILIELIPELLIVLREKAVIRGWFFIRYSDPKNHLRIRFNLRSLEDREILLSTVSSFFENLIHAHIVNDIQIGTYQRELERYGYATIDECEEWFYYNSETVLNLLEALKLVTENEKLMYGIYYAHQLLNQFQYDSSEKEAFTTSQSLLHEKEFNVHSNKAFRIKLNDEFRSHSATMKQLFDEKIGIADEFQNRIKMICNEHHEATNSIIEKIILSYPDRKSKINEIAASFIHMFVNRLFKDNQRNKEMSLYYFLSKYYTSTNARIKFS